VRKKILFVDDENDWRFMASMFLKESGYDVLTARDGTDALLKSEGVKLDLILLDVDLAGEDGVASMKFLKRSHPDVPIILYTGVVHDQQAIQSMLKAGAFQYLRKGTMEELMHVVQTAVGSPGDNSRSIEKSPQPK